MLNQIRILEGQEVCSTLCPAYGKCEREVETCPLLGYTNNLTEEVLRLNKECEECEEWKGWK